MTAADRRLSIVIPTLNAAAALPACLDALVEGGALVEETMVVDGGSSDATAARARELGARVLSAPRGRGAQLAAGMAAARGEWLMALHADTVLAQGWSAIVAAFIAAPGGDRVAGFGRLRFDEAGAMAQRTARLANWRARRLALPYGDQALVLHRRLYQAVGGYPSLPLMEDVALARALGRRRLRALDFVAVTSAERYRRAGWLARSTRNLCCLGLYLAGVAPARIARFYDR